MLEKKTVHVAAAIIRREGKLLICRRGPGGSCGGLWEFPGGKLEAGETAAQAVLRECREELSVEPRLGPVYAEVTHRYPERTVALTFFEAELLAGEPVRTVHGELRWVSPGELADYKFCPADEGLVRRLAFYTVPMHVVPPGI